ncbi:MAG: YHS domain-containing (seleno)protein [Alphaproteobacteria bacterium]|nr:YHS domain-containing (seleno)protein [Alphaproteobacteria bacterium]
MVDRASLTSRRAILGLAVVGLTAVAVVGFFSYSAQSEITTYNIDADRVAIHGYDTVAYFTEGKPLAGKAEFEHEWRDARWQFASAGNRDLFTANPERYAPKYGGYCAGGLATGEYADIDPEAWTIVDGKLYLNKTKELRVVWRKSPESHIAYGDYNWENNRAKLRNNL